MPILAPRRIIHKTTGTDGAPRQVLSSSFHITAWYKSPAAIRTLDIGENMFRARGAWFVLFVLVFTLTVCLAAFAQSESATLSGVISDPKGAVVPEVEVTATRIET